MTDIFGFNRHVGDSNVECLCPYGYRGNKCETHEFLNEDSGKKDTPKGSQLKNLFQLFFFTECILSKDSKKDEDSYECASKCMNDINNIELCRCHKNNEIGKENSIFLYKHQSLRQRTFLDNFIN